MQGFTNILLIIVLILLILDVILFYGIQSDLIIRNRIGLLNPINTQLCSLPFLVQHPLLF